MAKSRFDSSLLQHFVPRLTRLEQLHYDERERITSWDAGVAAADTCSVDMALNTNWMRRTGWTKTFAGANRKLLVELAQPPCVARGDLCLGTYGDRKLCSLKEDERRLVLMIAALDRLFDQCEDTAEHTDVSIRCWLRGQDSERPYKAPFELVGRKSTTSTYRRLLKRCICFCVRLWRLGDACWA
jgi:hypothetical protein